MTIITISGRINDPKFQQAQTIAHSIAEKNPGKLQVVCLEYFETQWAQCLKIIANQLKGVFYNH